MHTLAHQGLSRALLDQLTVPWSRPGFASQALVAKTTQRAALRNPCIIVPVTSTSKPNWLDLLKHRCIRQFSPKSQLLYSGWYGDIQREC
jgi:hypothetical protein